MHQNRLVIHADDTGGLTFCRQSGRIIDDHTRVSKQHIRDLLTQIRHAADRTQTQTDWPEPEPRPPRPRPQFDAQWLTPLPETVESEAEQHLHHLIAHDWQTPPD